MKITYFIILFFSLCSIGWAGEYCLTNNYPYAPKTWKTSDIPEKLYDDPNTKDIKSFYQVQPTKNFIAIRELKDKAFIKIDSNKAKDLAGIGYTIDKGSSAYLIRGLYNHPSGQLYLYWHPKTKSVRQAFVGLRNKPSTDEDLLFLPIIVNLPEELKHLYIDLVGIK